MSKRVKLNLDSFAYANIATKVMKLPPKAVFEAEDQFHIVVPMGTVGKAIGKAILKSLKTKKKATTLESQVIRQNAFSYEKDLTKDLLPITKFA